MATDALKSLQNKLFKGGDTHISESQSSEGKEPGLSIDIPKPAEMKPPPKMTKGSLPSPANGQEMPKTGSFRERLAQQLGDKYKGAEKYRLDQDDARKKHWKRWGPYLSDRQWVSE
jgi:hypothetical protein